MKGELSSSSWQYLLHESVLELFLFNKEAITTNNLYDLVFFIVVLFLVVLTDSV